MPTDHQLIYHLGGPDSGQTHEVTVFRCRGRSRDRVPLKSRFYPCLENAQEYYELIGFLGDGTGLSLYFKEVR